MKFSESEIAKILGRNFDRNSAESRSKFNRVDKGHFEEGLIFWQATKAKYFHSVHIMQNQWAQQSPGFWEKVLNLQLMAEYDP